MRFIDGRDEAIVAHRHWCAKAERGIARYKVEFVLAFIVVLIVMIMMVRSERAVARHRWVLYDRATASRCMYHVGVGGRP